MKATQKNQTAPKMKKISAKAQKEAVGGYFYLSHMTSSGVGMWGGNSGNAPQVDRGYGSRATLKY